MPVSQQPGAGSAPARATRRPRSPQARRWRAWAVPAAVAACIAGATMAPKAFAANPHPSLPTRTAAQLIASVERSHVTAMSGTIRTAAKLGLPSLPNDIPGTQDGLVGLLSGNNTLRLWASGPERQRIALLGDGSEMDLIHNGRDVWTWNSTDQSVQHVILPAEQTATERTTAPAEQLTPSAQARQALRAIGPSTAVTVSRTARVAGRPAYTVTLTPRTTATLVGKVQIAIDAATSVPLRVLVFARGSSSPALSTGFTSVSFATPAASTFEFTPPSGASVRTHRLSAPAEHRRAHGARPAAEAAPQQLGRGWASVIELPAGSLGDGTGPGPSPSGSVLNELTNPVAAGRVLTTRLLSVLIAQDGRVFIGAVPASTLESLASSGR